MDTPNTISLKAAPDNENSLDNPARVFPTADIFAASSGFNYVFPGYSITVFRTSCLRMNVAP
jgi:hypothetical protein